MKYLLSISIFIIILFFAACEISNQSAPTVSEKDKEVYLQKGAAIASATFATLSGNLQKAMQAGGVPNAVKYCNLAAFPLVDSLSQVHKAKIKRTSLKVRNSKNQPTSMELRQLKSYRKQEASGEKLNASVIAIDEQKVAYYAPIQMMTLCEKCHGKIGESLLKKDYEVIKNLYPKDEAINYTNGDWRGMWSITFEK